MLLRNKTKYTIPINGTKARGERLIDVPDDCKYDENYFEKVTTKNPVVYSKKINSTKSKGE